MHLRRTLYKATLIAVKSGSGSSDRAYCRVLLNGQTDVVDLSTGMKSNTYTSGQCSEASTVIAMVFCLAVRQPPGPSVHAETTDGLHKSASPGS